MTKFFATNRESLKLRWQWIAFAVALVAVVSRDASLFTHAQFYAEDGKFWFADAYNQGWWRPLAVPNGGYLNTLQRLIADMALLVPFRWAPLTMNLGGLFVQVLPVPILLSERCRSWGPLPLRLVFAAVYVGIPDAREIHVVCTNAQWHLAVAMLLLAFAPEPAHWLGKVTDLLLIAVGAVSGPFGLLLIPFVCVFWWMRRQRWTAFVLSMLACGGVVQLVMLALHHVQRNPMYLGATVERFIRLLGGNAFLGAMLGTHTYGVRFPFVVSLAALLIGLALIAYCFRFATLEVKLFLVFCFAVFAAGIRSPYFIYSPRPLWEQLLITPAQRYSFFPSLALLFAILWCALLGRRFFRMAGMLLALITCLGIIRDWKIPSLPYKDFSQDAAVFEAAPAGTTVTLPVFPVYPDWQMVLIKKPHDQETRH